jgi:two-component system cell cycle sensor histidine kinase/response regulator CckA
MMALASFVGSLKHHVERVVSFGTRKPRRVLVVDDDTAMRQYLKNVLTAAGYVAVPAHDGADALEKFEQDGPFDLLVTDVVMPLVSGDELARRIRKIEPTMPVLYVTGYSDELFKQKPLLWQDEAFLDKPCSPASVVDAVSMLMNARVPQKTVWA